MDSADDTQAEGSKKISFRFCRECSNLLYPKEDVQADKLMFACRSCHYTENATSECVYRNALQEQIAETPGNIVDVAQDPTVGNESNSQSVVDSFMTDAYEYGGEDERYPETCTYCGKEILCPSCGEATDGGLLLEVADPAAEQDEEKRQALEDAERRERALSSAGQDHR